MSEIYIFSQDDKLLTTLSESTGLVSTLFKDQINSAPDEPFVFTVDADEERAKHVKEENQVVFRDKEGDLRLYSIKEIEDVDNNDGPQTTAICEPAFMELKEHIVVDRRFVDKEAQEALNAALDGTRWTGTVEISLGIATTNFYYITSIDAIWKILEVWGGEIKDVVTFDGNKITKREIRIKQRLGADKGLRFEIDHNITEIQRTVLSYPVTALYGRGASLQIEDEETGEHTGGFTRLIDFADVEWKKSKGDPVDKPKGQKWVGDPDALLKYGRKHNGKLQHRFGVWENGDYEDPTKLLRATWEALQQEKKPEVNYRLSVDLLDKDVSLGDTARAIDREFARPIEIQTRVIAIEYDLLDIEGSAVVEMGQFLSAYDNDLSRELDDLKNEIRNNRGKWESGGGPITNDRFPNIKPATPVNVEAIGGFRVIQLYWDYDEHVYISHYEVYGSQVKDFVPDNQHLLWRGRVSGFAHEVDTDQVWYYRVRAVNMHGRPSDWSTQVTASTVRIISDDILFGPEIAAELRELSKTAQLLADGTVNLGMIGADVTAEIDTAKNRAGEAVEKANLAASNANEAIEEAQGAFEEAQSAHNVADAAKEASDIAGRVAGEAKEQVAAAIVDARQAMTDAQAALKNVDDLQTSVDVEFKNINGQLSNKVSQKEFDGLKGTVTNHSTLIQQTQTDIKSKADQSYVNTVKGTVDSHSTLIQQNAKEIQSKASQSSVNTLTGRVSTAESRITQNAQKIESKMNTVDANAKFATQSQLTQKSDSLTSQITQVQTNLDSLEIGGRNLARNTKTKNFVSYQNGAIQIIDDGYIRVTNSAGVNANFGLMQTATERKMEIVEGEKYTISFEVRGTVSSMNYVYVMRPDAVTNQRFNAMNVPSSTEFTRVSSTHTANSGSNNAYLMIATRNEPNGAWFEIKNIKMEKGNRATDWSPAPEDLTTNVQFSELEQTVDSISTQVTEKVDKTIYDSFVQQTAQSLASKISSVDADKKYATQSRLTQTAQGLQTQVNNNKGNISIVTQLANTLQSRMSNAEGNISTLTQTASSLQSTISNVRKDLDGLEIGGRNYILGSEKTFSFSNATTATNYETLQISDDIKDLIKKDNAFVLSYDVKTTNGFKKGSVNPYVGMEFKYIATDDIARYVGYNAIAFGDLPDGENDFRLSRRFLISGDLKEFEYLRVYFRDFLGTATLSNFKIELGNKATDWTPAPEDMATQSQISQLSDAINLRVTKKDLINQINIDTSGILIAGQKVHITGQTKIDNAVIKTAMIANAAVGTAAIANAAITRAKLGTASVGTAQIEDGVITNAKIANLAVDSAKLANAAVTNAKIASLRADKIDGGIINANLVTVKVTNGVQAIQLDNTGLRSIDSNGKMRIHLGVRNIGGAGQSNPATMRFFSGNGAVSASIGMNVNDTFVIGSSAAQVAMELRSGKNTIFYAQQHRFVMSNYSQYWKFIPVDGNGGHNPGIVPSRSGRGYIGLATTRLWAIFTNQLHYIDLIPLSTRERKTNIKDANSAYLQSVFDNMNLVTFNYLNEDGSPRDDVSVGLIAEDSPDLITTKDKKALRLNNMIGVIGGSLKHQTSRIDHLEKLNEELILKVAKLEERIHELEAS